jgi:hypothetical protein
MTRDNPSTRIRRRLAVLAFGGMLFIGTGPLAGCKQAALDAFYSGLQNFAVGVIDTIFAAITPKPPSST